MTHTFVWIEHVEFCLQVIDFGLAAPLEAQLPPG